MAGAPADLEALEELEEAPAAAPPAEQVPKYRQAILCALGVALLVFVAGRGSAGMMHTSRAPPHAPAVAAALRKHEPSGAPLARAASRSASRPKPRLSKKEREAQRLNDVKTLEIREAQEDPTSMFDMSNAR